MSVDPNGTRWANSESNFGKALLKKSGWSEGTGLGKEQNGMTSHVRVVRKADSMGIGYQAGVTESWSTQSVGFADVLDRIKSAAPAVDDSDNDDEDGTFIYQSPTSDTSGRGSPSESRHYKMYAKRNALKTELLRGDDAEKQAEILGSASSHKRARDGAGGSGSSTDHALVQDSTLRSSTLRRVMVRCPRDEPKPTAVNIDAAELVHITKPTPRPPKCTDSPFLE